ncbi:hypothetical protein J1G43_07220 [Cellulomonas sp. zg-ZUI22]|uniref:hypothetical protein n=1 Tax=Cellulomonas sp. zg-ZUI22 TaxID=2816955 RepID=UPI001A943F8E|nr:hypothetical protein [Cellulomonas sp. zg-ZUI22]MBO0899753.1 hypothetical protein [Cellulomonas sp. zg-ZUI22]
MSDDVTADDATGQGTNGQGTNGQGTHGQGTTRPGTTPDPERGHRPPVRVGGVVWGLIVVLVGAGVLLVAAGYTIDVQLAVIVLLIAAGVGLIVGPVIQGLRRGRTP